MTQLFDLHLEHNGWIVGTRGALRGKPFVGAELLNPTDAIEQAATALGDGTFDETVAQWNGQFSVVAWGAEAIGIGVDRARSIPLFYAFLEGRPAVSDSANHLRRIGGYRIVSRDRIAQYLLAGFVLNDGTLCEEVCQVQSGQTVRLSCGGRDLAWRVEAGRRRSFRPLGRSEKGFSEPARHYRETLDAVFTRALRAANGRQIVVPLSGGLDSRVLLTMLVRKGVRDLQAYTYGASEEEVGCSEYVARSLGVPWHRCDYSVERWRSVSSDVHFHEYLTCASGLASVPCIQEWLAVGELKATGLLRNGAMFMPGYAADLPAGSFLTALGARGRRTLCSRAAFVSLLRSHRLSLWRSEEIAAEVMAKVEEALECSVDSIGPVSDWASALDTWMLDEKVPKFTVNAVRAFESHGYDWWLPYFDVEFLSFWENVEVESRLGEALHWRVADDLFRETSGEAPPERIGHGMPATGKGALGVLGVVPWLERLARSVYSSGGLRMLRDARRRRGLEEWYGSEPMGWTGIFPLEEVLSAGLKGANGINGMLGARTLALMGVEDLPLRKGSVDTACR